MRRARAYRIGNSIGVVEVCCVFPRVASDGWRVRRRGIRIEDGPVRGRRRVVSGWCPVAFL